ncbi:MAG: hypothetical protein WA485_15825 [Candidatus Sulfotelmatobacter sp.]
MRKIKTLIAILFCAVLISYAQKAARKKSAPQPAPPDISADFSKAAVHALLTIQSTGDYHSDDYEAEKRVRDAAMVDLEAETVSDNEKSVLFYVTSFRVTHNLRGHTPQEADCMRAWLPELRAQRATNPQACQSK